MDEEIDPAAMGALNGQQPQQPPPQAPPLPKQGQEQGQGKLGALGKAMQQWMMESHTVAATGGNVVQAGYESAYNSYADLAENMMKNNIPGARQARSKWKEAAEGTLAFNGSRVSEYSQIWGGDAPIEDKLGELNEIASGHYHDQIMSGLAQEQNITAIGRYLDYLNEQQQKAEAATMQLEKQFAEIEAKMPAADAGPMQ